MHGSRTSSPRAAARRWTGALLLVSALGLAGCELPFTPPPADDPAEPPPASEAPTDPAEPPTDPGEPPTDPGEPPTDPGEPPTDPGEPPAGDTVVVSVRSGAEGHEFEPEVVTVPVGTTVTWAFEDTGAAEDGAAEGCNVVADDGSFASDVLETGEFSHTFAETGTFPYTCTLHPGTDGVVEVVE